MTGILDYIGNTPLVRLNNVSQSNQVEIWAKLEWFNPSGSVKARAAWNMIREALRRGELRPGQVIVDSTSGNTGIAYAMVGAALGYKVLLAMPSNASPERKKILEGYGARLHLTDPLKGSDGSIEVVRELYAEKGDQYYYPDQYSNDDNWKAHYSGTAEEIWQQTGQSLTHFVAGLGTTGTFVGTARRLKELDPAIRAVSFQPDSPFHGLEGLKHLPTALTPEIYDNSIADENLDVNTEKAQDMVIRLAREEGLFVGLSSGAAMLAALEVARNFKQGKVVTIFPDSGDRYLSEEFWQR